MLACAGCSYDGITSVSLPFREGTGADSYQITIEMERVSGLTQNGEVKIDDVTVGTIESMSLEGWTAALVIGLNEDVRLPVGTRARVGQKSLLGAKYLELTTPDDDENSSSTGTDEVRPASAGASDYLEDGDRIELAATGTYPETEEVLSALAVVLNGSGLQQVRTITTELNHVFGGRQSEVRLFLDRFNRFVRTLDQQRSQIVDVLERLNSTAKTLRTDRVLDEALQVLPEALTVLDDDRASLVRTLRAVSQLSTTAETVIDESGADLRTVLADVQPVLSRLADSGSDVVDSLSVLVSFPFPSNTAFPDMFKGDYGNLFLTLDVSPKLLLQSLRLGFAEGPGTSVLNAPPLGAGDRPSSPIDPFVQDLAGLGKDLGLGTLLGTSENEGLLGQLLRPRSAGVRPASADDEKAVDRADN